MGNRLRDYGFTSPFRAHVKGSNYNASLADLSGGAINQFLTDVSTYNTIIKNYGLTSQLEYKQPDGSWGTAVPPRPATKVKLEQQNRGVAGLNSKRYTQVRDHPLSQPTPESELVKTLPEYRWRIFGDVNGANQALRDAGLQGSYKQPNGQTINTGASFTATVPGKSVTLTTPIQAYGGSQRGGTVYLDTADPLGAGIGGSHSAIDRAYSGATAPQYYTLPNRPLGTGTTIDGMSDQSYGTYYVKRVADEVFSNPNLGNLKYNPTGLKAALDATPQISNDIGTYFNDTAGFWRQRDNDGGGPLGVIAKGLAGVAQFASMASGLNAGVSFLGSLAKGANLAGAYGAAKAGASAIPSLGGGIAQLAGKPGLSNIISSGIGAFTGGVQGGLPGAALGGLSGYVPGLPGAAIGQIGRAAGIGAPPAPPRAPAPMQFASSLQNLPNMLAARQAPSVASAIARSSAPQAQRPMTMGNIPNVPMSAMGLLSGAMPGQIPRPGIFNAPRMGGMTGMPAPRPVTFGGMPVNQQAIMANLPQVLANIRSRAGGAPPAAA